jgi:hypothetical protein
MAEGLSAGRTMRVFLGFLLTACFTPASHASAGEVAMSCVVQDTTPKHAQRTFELSFDQANQLVYISKSMATAAITPSTISFRVDLASGVPFSFAIDRLTGVIRVTGTAGALYNGECKVVEAKGS